MIAVAVKPRMRTGATIEAMAAHHRPLVFPQTPCPAVTGVSHPSRNLRGRIAMSEHRPWIVSKHLAPLSLRHEFFFFSHLALFSFLKAIAHTRIPRWKQQQRFVMHSPRQIVSSRV